VVDVEHDLVGLEHRPARGDGQVVQEVERLGLLPEPEDEVHRPRDHAGSATTRGTLAAVPERPGLVVVTPLAPARTGNGLAMRAATLVDGARVDHRVHLVVVPVAGGGEVDGSGLASTEVVALAAPGAPGALAAVVADPAWRQRWAAMAPPPAAVLAGSPALAAPVADRLAGEGVRGVVALRTTVAPFALALAEALGVPLVVDADDDDERLQRDLGHDDLASAHGRLAGVVLPAARAVLAAGAADADGLTRRHRLAPPAVVVPNAAPPAPTEVLEPPGDRRALLMANLTYEPNVVGARWLVDEVLEHLEQDWHLDLVGEAVDDVVALAGPRVGVHGRVDDLTPWYAGADVVVVPLHHGAGSRIKVLEAFARRRPVVSTSVGVAGLDAVAGEQALVADDPVAFARAVESASRPDAAARLVAAGTEVAARHAPEVVVPLVAQRLAAALDL
jgi:hypothetical protein